MYIFTLREAKGLWIYCFSDAEVPSCDHNDGINKNGRRSSRLPSNLSSFARPDSRGRLSPRVLCLRGFAWGLGFQGLLAANVDFDLLGLGFRLFCKADLQN